MARVKVERWFESEDRRRNHERAKERGHVFTIEQIMDVYCLFLNGGYPDGNWGDDECALYSAFNQELFQFKD